MSKVITLTKKPSVWEEVSDMLEGFVEAITDESTGMADDISCVVLMYRTNDGDVTFECTTSATADMVGMMAAAVHMACLYEIGPEDGDETLH